MTLFEKKPSFTLALIPDSGLETKTGSINIRIITISFTILLAVFFTCLFFIIGYHVKLFQEQGYRVALTDMEHHLTVIEKNTRQLNVLTEKVTGLQELDKAFRQYAAMTVPDENMYLAGIGGHAIIDDSQLFGMNKNLADRVRELLLTVISIDRKVFVEQNSLESIRTTIEKRNDIINNTPSILPTQSLNITSSYGMRRNPITGVREFHNAVDFNGRLGDKIFTAADGEVVTSKYHPTRGYCVVIQHKYGYQTLYAHLNAILVTVGQKVKKHDVIGTMGKTGRATGVNLHYSVSHNNRTVNPIDYF